MLLTIDAEKGPNVRKALLSSFLLSIFASALIACGDDDGGVVPDAGDPSDAGETPTDGGSDPVEVCPDDGPDPEGLMGECCYRHSNADRLANPEFRVSGLNITRPASLGNVIVQSALKTSLEDELFNWLIRLEGLGESDDVRIVTGYGARNEDATFSFADGNAPEPGDPNRWDPSETDQAMLDGETVSTPLINEFISLPIFEEDEVTVSLELPLTTIELIRMEMSVDRTCVGERTRPRYDTSHAEVRTFVRIEDSKGTVNFPGLSAQLCNFIRGHAAYEGDCEEVPVADWTYKPDAICEEDGCREANEGECATPDTCNAWTVQAQFAAHGVEITD